MTSAECHVKETKMQNNAITNRENGNIPSQKYILSVFILNASISMDCMSIILLPSCFPRQDASNDIHDDPNGPI